MIAKLFLSVLIGYALGCVNAAYYYAKRKGENIFSIGSATAGATNIARKFGVKAGIAVGVFDGLKMIAALWLVQRITGGSAVCVGAAMIACICGHIFPAQLGTNCLYGPPHPASVCDVL